MSIRIGLTRRHEPELAPLIISTIGAALVIIAAAATGSFSRSTIHDLWPFAAIGAMVPGLSQLVFVRAIRDAGPARASVLIGTAPIIAAVLAVGFLGEPLGPVLAIATGLIVAGGTVLAWERSRPAGFRPIGVALALACAVLFAVRDNLVRAVSTDVDAAPLAAAAASLTGAALTLIVILLLIRRTAVLDLGRVRATIAPFAPAAALLGMAYVALIEAFARGTVTVVAPLNATQSLWAVVFAAVILGRSEAIGWRLMFAASLIVSGSILVGVTR